ncbi:hypothetical protein APSETT444_000047 [Aspergillus pseudonomiae]
MRYFFPLAIPAIIAAQAVALETKQLFNFSTAVAIENSALRPDGNLLLTTFDQGRLYTLNPSLPSPQAELVAALPGATALCGIAAIDTDKFAVIGGIRGNYSYTNETIYTVDFSTNPTNPTIQVVSQLPNAIMLNGMAALPAHPHVVLAGDARLGAVFRVNTDTGAAEIAFTDPLLTAPSNASTPIGVNGLKIAGGYMYFTNTAREIFARVPIDGFGEKTGDIEVIATLDDADSYNWDDFVVLEDLGVAFLAQPDTAIAQVSLDGEQNIIVGGGDDRTTVVGPTSLAITQDGKTLYVTTRGGTAISSILEGQDNQGDRDSFEEASRLLAELKDAGNCVAPEYCHHVEVIEAALTAHAKRMMLSENSGGPGNGALSTSQLAPTMPRGGLLWTDSSLQQLHSQPALDVQLLEDAVRDSWSPGSYGPGFGNNFEVRMVGSRRTGSMPNNDHEGWRGNRIDEITNKAMKSVERLMPNLLTVNAGSNDCIQAFRVDKAGQRMNDLLEYIWHAAPNSTVLLSTLLVNSDEQVNERVMHVNDQFRALAEKKAALQRRIVLVDLYNDGPHVDDLVDGIHPNDEGYDQVAVLWFNGIQRALEQGLIVGPNDAGM